MIKLNRTDKVVGVGITYEVSIDGCTKAYLIEEKYKNELLLHIPGVLPIKEVRQLLEHLILLEEQKKNNEAYQYSRIKQ